MPRITALIVLLLCTFRLWGAQNAEVVRISEEQRAIYQQVSRTDGELTEDMHRQFWAGMPGDAAQREEMRRKLYRTENADLARMRAMYLSIRATLKNHVATVDPSYARAQATFESLDPGNDDDRRAVREKIAREDRLFHTQLEQIARGEKLHRGDEEIEMTPELVDEILNDLDETYDRVKRLLNPKWHAH